MKLRETVPALALAAASSSIVSCSTAASLDIADADGNDQLSQDDYDRYD